jgi:hypothetical protein
MVERGFLFEVVETLSPLATPLDECLLLDLALVLARLDPSRGAGEPGFDTIETRRYLVEGGGVSGAGFERPDTLEQRLIVG